MSAGALLGPQIAPLHAAQMPDQVVGTDSTPNMVSLNQRQHLFFQAKIKVWQLGTEVSVVIA